jgi:23S rRNA (uracil-5-)-methyltransferase RumA
MRRLVLDSVRSAELVDLRCRHAGECGGCAFQDRAYAGQVAAKRTVLRTIWENDLPGALLETLEVIPSPSPYGYRTRMDYVATKGRFGLRRGGKFNYIVELEECHLIPPSAFAVARSAYAQAVELGLPDYNLRTHEGFLRYVVVRRSPDDRLLLALVTAQGDYVAEVAQLAEVALINPHVISFHWLLNDSLTDVSFGASIQHWGAETLPMPVGGRTLQIGPNTFFQNNIHLLLPLLDDVRVAVRSQESGVRSRKPTVADLYGGVGTIALHLADHVASVTCVESVAESVRLAERAIVANGVTNVAAIEADVGAFLQQAAAEAGEASPYDFVIADPPRTGLGPLVCRELLRLRPQRIVYVSCNPLTQLEDTRILTSAYQLTELRGYDMFPHTPHLESLAIFDRLS